MTVTVSTQYWWYTLHMIDMNDKQTPANQTYSFISFWRSFHLFDMTDTTLAA